MMRHLTSIYPFKNSPGKEIKIVYNPSPPLPRQTLWCLSYRPWARDGGFLWIPALMLGGTAVTLGGAHAVLREAWFARDMEFPQYVAAHLPLRCVWVVGGVGVEWS